jgi:hypothetical protein
MPESINSADVLHIASATPVLEDPQHLWHALRGYDFAALESIVNFGLEPGQNQDDLCTCVSAAPIVSLSMNRQANSLCTYSLDACISIALNSETPKYPKQEYGGFSDEVRLTPQESNGLSLYGLMLPEEVINAPLEELYIAFQPRKPSAAAHYIEVTTDYLEDLGQSPELQQTKRLVRPLWQKSERGHILTSEEHESLERHFMGEYSKVASRILGIAHPNTSSMLSIIFRRTGKKLPIYTWGKDIKNTIVQANKRVAGAKRITRTSSGRLSLAKTIETNI